MSSDLRFDTNNITKASFKQVDRGLTNNIWVYGNRRLTGWENNFTGDGGSVYTLDYNPFNVEVFVGGSATPKNGGVFNLNVGTPGSPTQYLVDYDNKKVIFISGTSAGDNIPVSGTDAISIPYQRQTPIVKFGIDRVSQSAYGKREKVIVDKNITDPEEAISRVNTTLLQESSPVIEGLVEVNNIVDITPGQTVTVDLPTQNVDETSYEVIEVTYDIDRTNELGNNLTTVKLNKRIIDITDTIKQLQLELRKIQSDDANESNIYTRMESAIGELTLQRNWTIKTRTIGQSFVLGHSVNGKLGSPTVGVNGSQVTLGSSGLSAFSTQLSGGTF
jgi:hypothetical protein